MTSTTSIEARVALAKAAQALRAEAAEGLDGPKPESGKELQEATTETTGSGQPTQGEATTAGDQELASTPISTDFPDTQGPGVSLPDEVLARILQDNNIVGLQGPIVEGTAAEVVDSLHKTRSLIVEGKGELPALSLETIDRTLNEIVSTSDALIYNAQVQAEREAKEAEVAESERAVAEIAAAGGDVAAVPSPVSEAGQLRRDGYYGYIAGEHDFEFSSEQLKPLVTLREVADELTGIRELVASHQITIARMNPYAGSQMLQAVFVLDSAIARMHESCAAGVETEDAQG